MDNNVHDFFVYYFRLGSPTRLKIKAETFMKFDIESTQPWLNN